MWFTWKARNDKVFNEKTIEPPKTVLHATQEAEEWKVAQVVTSMSHASPLQDQEHVASDSPFPRCPVDASWVKNSNFVGGGCVFDFEPDTHIYGSFGIEHVLSPLHAEFSVLLCAMRCSLQLGFKNMFFVSDCLQLVKLINEEEEWPILTSEWNDFEHTRAFFSTFSISFIARKPNVRADLLAKGVRSKFYFLPCKPYDSGLVSPTDKPFDLN
ncbi:hypothetical protein F2Q68_00019214 [Brassica cretica]|uniref:RNase H type-1 domain-containing protein n=1 Tax=Brassica cretica TaxID=69181 RepID=A0A8S9FW48_BRACR|nr:hypothetical protein F2Q68_00019214 [Brassica cretica]